MGEAILSSEYAQIENTTESEVIALINARKLLGVYFRGVWYVEAPSFCEMRLSQIWSQRQPPGDQKRHCEQTHSSTDAPSVEVVHGRILGLHGQVSLADIKRHYRERMMEYHPDKVASLGPKLRELAENETKKINAAYEYFTAKYASNR